MYKNNLWKDQYGIRAPFSNKSRVYYTIIIWLMRHNTMNARMKMWQGYTDCMTWNVNKRKQTAGGWERAGGHRLATVRGLRLWLCLDWLITELICIFFNFKQTTNFSTIHLQNVIHQSGCGRTSVKNVLELWDKLYICSPIGIETIGSWGAEVHTIVKEIGRKRESRELHVL